MPPTRRARDERARFVEDIVADSADVLHRHIDGSKLAFTLAANLARARA